MTARAKVAICIPSGEDIKVETHSAVLALVLANASIIAHVFNHSSSRIAYNRNALVERALKINPTHILFIDADMTFPRDSITKLLSHDLPIVGATASRRGEDDDAIGKTLDGGRLKIPSPPVKMQWLGMPFMLIHMDVIKKMKPPYFAEPPWWMMTPNSDPCPETPGLVPEDEYFCIRARELGYDIWCDIELSMSIGHRGAKTYRIMKPQAE